MLLVEARRLLHRAREESWGSTFAACVIDPLWPRSASDLEAVRFAQDLRGAPVLTGLRARGKGMACKGIAWIAAAREAPLCTASPL